MMFAIPIRRLVRWTARVLLLVPLVACHPAAEAPTVATLLPSSRPLADVTLTGSDGRPLSLQNVRGQPTVLFFGYASCPDLCPTTLVTLTAAVRSLHDLPAADRPRILFVSVDPARDTPAHLAAYAGHFGPEVVAATGPLPDLERLTRSVGATFAVPAAADPVQGYAVAHSPQVYVLNAHARLVAVFSPPHEAGTIGSDLRRIVNLTRDSP